MGLELMAKRCSLMNLSILVEEAILLPLEASLYLLKSYILHINSAVVKQMSTQKQRITGSTSSLAQKTSQELWRRSFLQNQTKMTFIQMQIQMARLNKKSSDSQNTSLWLMKQIKLGKILSLVAPTDIHLST